MTDLRKAAQQALEALDAYSWEQVDAARTALKAALAEPVQEKMLKQQAQVNRDVLTTHSADCYKWHHECAIAEVERLRAFAAHPEQAKEAEKVAYAAGWYQSMCAHCTDPRYAGLRCSVCGRWSDDGKPVRKRKPLTDAQIDALIDAEVSITDQNLRGAVYLAMRAVEQAHGIEE